MATDGCGNYYALSFACQDADGECPVVFFEAMESYTDPVETVAPTYADFIVRHMALQCRRVRCSTPPAASSNEAG